MGDGGAFLEKSNWVVLVVGVPTLLVYLATVVPQVLGQPMTEVAWVPPMIAAMVAFVVAMTGAGHFWIANALFLGGIVGSPVSCRHQDRRVPPAVPGMVKPTRVTNTIRSLRFANGEMTQAELADRVGVTRQTIIAIEQGRYSPTLEMAFRIARVFRVPLDEVFRYADAPD